LVGIVLFLLVGVPALLHVAIIRAKWFLSSWVTLIGTVFDSIPCVGTVIADPGARFLQVVCIRMPA
jgi:hypothetical protein